MTLSGEKSGFGSKGRNIAVMNFYCRFSIFLFLIFNSLFTKDIILLVIVLRKRRIIHVQILWFTTTPFLNEQFVRFPKLESRSVLFDHVLYFRARCPFLQPASTRHSFFVLRFQITIQTVVVELF